MASRSTNLFRLNRQEQRAYDKAFEAALLKAGGAARLAHELSITSGDYISHQAIRNWRLKRSIPPQWALVMEEYHEAANFFDLIPWLRDRALEETAA
jgi:hypothetical protein